MEEEREEEQREEQVEDLDLGEEESEDVKGGTSGITLFDE